MLENYTSGKCTTNQYEMVFDGIKKFKCVYIDLCLRIRQIMYFAKYVTY